jgi:hypothetical protein
VLEQYFCYLQFTGDFTFISVAELEQMDKEDSKTSNKEEKEDPVYPSLSLSNDFHNVARFRILSVSGKTT